MRFPHATRRNIYVASQRAGERVMESVSRFLEKRLRLKLNRDKSAVNRPWKRKFLGCSMTAARVPRLKVARESEERLRANRRVIFKRGRGRSVRQMIGDMRLLLIGWSNYYKLADRLFPGISLIGRVLFHFWISIIVL